MFSVKAGLRATGGLARRLRGLSSNGALVGCALMLASTAHAGLTRPPAAAGVAAGDPMGALKYWLGVGLGVAILAICGFAFLQVASGLVVKFGEWRSGRAELGDLTTLGVVGLALLAVIIYLLTEGSTVFTSTAAAIA